MLEAVVDDNGDSISIYEQKDIGEFFLNLLDRLQDGLGENKTLIRKALTAEFERSSTRKYLGSYEEKKGSDDSLKQQMGMELDQSKDAGDQDALMEFNDDQTRSSERNQ